ncbi:MAG: YjbH domain-containing protein [Gammaproteobacteria bacterium]|nr:YjbH domain-containing protein [Gammaproteobacteria bacterium]
MPDARLDRDGSFRLGFSNFDPYSTLWSSVTVLPRLELSARYTTIDNISVFEAGDNVGNFRDKAFDAKLVLFPETGHLPQLAVGAQDFHGTRLFSAEFVTLSKRIGALDLTLGYGSDRLDGGFGGLRYRPAWARSLGLVVEYDANDYRRDHEAASSGAAERAGGATYALEYRYGWLGTQLSWQDGEVGANIHVTVPLMEREFIPKIDEPPPVRVSLPLAPLTDWRVDARYSGAIEDALRREGFRNLHVTLHGKTLSASLSHPRISSVRRIISRAARILVQAGPQDLESVTVTYTGNDLPVVTYVFRDIPRLREYFAGTVSWDQVESGVDVIYAEAAIEEAPHAVRPDASTGVESAPGGEDAAPVQAINLIGDGGGRYDQDEFQLNPFNLRFLFNITRTDPGRAFHYDVFSLLSYRRHLGHGLFFSPSGRLQLYEDVSDVSAESDSLLPHVRSDVAEYKQGGRLRLDSLLVNRYLDLPGRMSARLSAGYYEEMFAGAGGQLLYPSRDGRWALDLMVDGLRQREPGDNLALRDYSVLTALVSGHYRLPWYGLTATVRAGQFLARDDGIRYELNRRFRSGVEIGAWYSITNGHDMTGPGSPDDPYRDKGVYFVIPFSSMLTMDTRETARLSLSPWMRDVGQMVVPPDDLYRLMEPGIRTIDGGPLPLQ